MAWEGKAGEVRLPAPHQSTSPDLHSDWRKGSAAKISHKTPGKIDLTLSLSTVIESASSESNRPELKPRF